MELPLGEDPRTAILRRLQALLVQRFGHIERAAAAWRQPEWVLVQGVIGARTKSEVSNAATDRLLRKWGSWEAAAEAPVEALQAELATQTYPNIAAERLKACLTELVRMRGAVDLTHLAGLETGAAMDQANENGATPLFMACQNGHLELAKLLSSYGASRAATPFGTPEEIANRAGHADLAAWLVASRGWTPLQHLEACARLAAREA